jgi:hypothetical protein
MLVAISCIFKVLSSNTVIATLSSYVAYTAIGFLPGFVMVATPSGSLMKNNLPDLITGNWRRHLQD